MSYEYTTISYDLDGLQRQLLLLSRVNKILLLL